MNKFVLVLCLVAISASLFGQASERPIMENSKVNFGMGLGLDYGFLGGRLTFMPAPKVGLFGSVGYFIVGAGYNFGVNYKFMPDRRLTPYITGMYGSNAAIMVEGLEQYDKIYYGPSLGFGIELKKKRKTKNFWNFGLIIPIRSQEYQDDWDEIKSIPGIVIESEPLPVTITVGFHFGLD